MKEQKTEFFNCVKIHVFSVIILLKKMTGHNSTISSNDPIENFDRVSHRPMRTLHSLIVAVIVAVSSSMGVGHVEVAAQSNIYTIPLTYTTSAEGLKPNFFPTGTRVALTEVPADQALPNGAMHPASHGIIQVGPTQESWIPMLLTATAAEPGVFARLYIDINRNGDFSDDGPPALGDPVA